MKRILLMLLASFSISAGAYAGNGITLYVDAGHGGSDAGAVAKDGTKESDLCLQYARMLEQKGAGREVNIVLIRNNDEFIQLTDRIAKSTEAQKNAYFVSLHLEASKETADRGSLIIVDANNQIDGTQQLGRAMMHHFGKLGPVKAERKSPLVVRQSRIPAVIVSPGYISNETDLARLKTKAFQEEVAETILSAVLSLQ